MDKKTEIKLSKQFKKDYEVFIRSGRSYVGSVDLLQDRKLNSNSKVLFHIISALSFKCGYCFASNETLSFRINLSITSLKKYLSELITAGLITTKMETVKYGTRRLIFIEFAAMRKRYLQKRENEEIE